MEGPIHFILEKDGKFEICEEAIKILNGINGPFSVVAVCGPYRTGKSYLLNRFLNRQKGFSVGPTVNPETRGIYMWNRPVNISRNNGEVVPTFLIDTEGIGSVQQHKTHDVKIFSLALLLCDYLVYNAQGVIDERAIDMLSLISELSKWLASKSDSSMNTNDSEFFPSFAWVLRDFTLDLVDELGQKISSNQYLENCLKDRDGPEQEQKNKIKRALKNYFSTRDCFCLVRPISDEKALRNIDSIPAERLRPEFLLGVEELVNTVKNKLPVKTLFHKPISGSVFVTLIEKYVHSVNTGVVPTISDTWKSVADAENNKSLDKAIRSYEEKMENEMHKIPFEAEYLKNIHASMLASVRKFLSQNLLGDELQSYYEKLEHHIAERYEKYFQKNSSASTSYCENLIKDLFAKLIEVPLREKQFGTAMDVTKMWRRLYNEYEKQAKGTGKVDILVNFVYQKMGETFIEFFAQVDARVKVEIDEQNKKIEKLRVQLEEAVHGYHEVNMKLVKTTADKDKLLDTKERLEKEIQILNGKMKDAQQEYHRLREEMNSFKQKAEEHINKLSNERENALIQIQKLQNSISEKDSNISQAHKNQQLLQEQLHTLKKNTDTEAKQYESHIKNLTQEKDTVLAKMQQESSQLRGQLENLLREKDSTAAQVQKNQQLLQEQLHTLKTRTDAEAKQYELHIKKLSQEKDTVLAKMQQESDQLRGQLENLLREKDSTAAQVQKNQQLLQDQIQALKMRTDAEAKQYESQIKKLSQEKETLLAKMQQESDQLRGQLENLLREKDSTAAQVQKNHQLLQEQLHALRTRTDAEAKQYASHIKNLTQEKDTALAKMQQESDQLRGQLENLLRENNSTATQAHKNQQLLQEQLQALKTKSIAEAKQYDENLKNLTQEKDSILAMMQQESGQLRTQLETLESVSKYETKQNETYIKKLSQEKETILTHMQKESGQLRTQIETLEAVSKEQLHEIQTKTKNLDKTQAMVQQLQKETQDLQEELKKQKMRWEKETEVSQEKSSDLNKATHKTQVLEGEVQTLQMKLVESQENLSRRMAEIHNLQTDLRKTVDKGKESEKLLSELNSLREEIQKYQGQSASLQQDKIHLQQKYTLLDSEAQELRTKHTTEMRNLYDKILVVEQEAARKSKENELLINKMKEKYQKSESAKSEIEEQVKTLKYDKADLQQKVLFLDNVVREMMTRPSVKEVDTLKQDKADLQQQMLLLNDSAQEMRTKYTNEERRLTERMLLIEQEAVRKEEEIQLLQNLNADLKQQLYKQNNTMDGRLLREAPEEKKKRG